MVVFRQVTIGSIEVRESETGSGLSSSSALVCSSAIAILTAHNVLKQVTQSELAEFTCWCERYSGTESGGMDQAISIMAKTGFAKLIEFNPVRLKTRKQILDPIE